MMRIRRLHIHIAKARARGLFHTVAWGNINESGYAGNHLIVGFKNGEVQVGSYSGVKFGGPKIQPNDKSKYSEDAAAETMADLQMQWDVEDIDSIVFRYKAHDGDMTVSLYVSENGGSSYTRVASQEARPGEEMSIADKSFREGPCRYAIVVTGAKLKVEVTDYWLTYTTTTTVPDMRLHLSGVKIYQHTYTCATATNLRAGNITPTSATLNWDASPANAYYGDNLKYKVVYSRNGQATPDTTEWLDNPTTPITLTSKNNSPQYTYSWYVITNCGVTAGKEKYGCAENSQTSTFQPPLSTAPIFRAKSRNILGKPISAARKPIRKV